MTVMKIFLNVVLATHHLVFLKIRRGELFQVENWRSNFLLWQFACAAVRAASVTKLNLLKERGNSSPYFKSPKPSKESLHFHFPFFLFTMTIQIFSSMKAPKKYSQCLEYIVCHVWQKKSLILSLSLLGIS